MASRKNRAEDRRVGLLKKRKSEAEWRGVFFVCFYTEVKLMFGRSGPFVLYRNEGCRHFATDSLEFRQAAAALPHLAPAIHSRPNIIDLALLL